MSTAAKTRPRKKGERKEGADQHRRYVALKKHWKDEWDLLNAFREEVRKVCGDRYFHQDVEDLADLLEALRVMYEQAATGILFDEKGNPQVEEQKGQWDRFWETQETGRRIISKFYGTLQQSFFPTPEGVLLLWRRVKGPDDPGLKAVETMARRLAGPGKQRYISVDFAEPLTSLFDKLRTASRSTVFVCDYCGRIGPAKQHNKRFCGATCRQRAYRKSKVDPRRSL